MKLGFLFRILNFISDDSLRNTLAVGVRLPLTKALECLNDNHHIDAIREIERAIKAIDDIFKM